MASAEMRVTISLDDPKAIAAMMVIRDMASSIAEEQPWNDEAKNIRRLAKNLLKRLRIKRSEAK